MKEKKITTEDAIKLLDIQEWEGLEVVHTFMNSHNGMVIGADWEKEKIEKVFRENEDTLQLSGPMARNMGHGIVVSSKGKGLFVATDREKINTFDPIK